MKTFLTALSVILCTAGIVDAQPTQPQSPFNHRTSYHTTYSKKATEYLPQRMLMIRWDDVSMDWSAIADTMYLEYNSNGKIIKQTSIIYYKDQDTIYSNTYAFTYNQNNQHLATYGLIWKEHEQQWDTIYKSIWEYDSHGYETLFSSYSKTGNTFELNDSYKSINSYDTNGRLIEIFSEVWIGDEYFLDTKEIYAYDGSGKVNGLLTLKWDSDDSKFDTSSETTNIVWHKWLNNFEDGLIQSYEIQDRIGTPYELSLRMNTVYDSHDNITEQKEENHVNNNWEIRSWIKNALTYNASNALIQTIMQTWNGDSLVNFRKDIYDNFVSYNGLQHLAKQSAALAIYPNPIEEVTTIEIPSFNHSGEMVLLVFDLLGRSVLTQPIDAPKTILKKGNLQQGIYTFHLMENNNVTHSGKFIIK